MVRLSIVAIVLSAFSLFAWVDGNPVQHYSRKVSDDNATYCKEFRAGEPVAGANSQQVDTLCKSIGE